MATISKQQANLDKAQQAFLEGVVRAKALISFQAKLHPNSAWANSYFAQNALLGSPWVDAGLERDLNDHTSLALSIPGDQAAAFFAQKAQLLCKIVIRNEVPSYDLELLGEIQLSDHDCAESYYVVRSGDQRLYFYGDEQLADTTLLEGELERLRETSKLVEALLAL